MCLKDWRASCEMLRADSRRMQTWTSEQEREAAIGVHEGGRPGDETQESCALKGTGGGR